MIRSAGTTLVIVALTLTVIGLAVPPRWTAAQAPAPNSESTPSTQTASKPATSSVLQGSQLITFAVVGAGFATVVLLILFLYMYGIQRRYYDVVERAGASGVAFQTTWVAAFPGVNIAAAGAPAAQVSIKGPAAVTVGALSSEFSLEGDAAAAQQAQWAVDPPAAAAVIPDRGPTVKVVPVSAGVFTLVATVAGQAIRAQVAATLAQPARTDLPFVGGGYGAVLVAVVLLIAVTTLAVAGVLGSEAIGTLFGGLLGYVFGATQGSRRGEKPAEESAQS